MKNSLKLFKFIKKIVYSKRNITVTKMANSRYEYVRFFEQENKVLLNCWIVVRIDGKAFHKFTKIHDFDKPNDENALNLMNHAAITVMNEFRDIILSYGQSDEYSFIFHKSTDIYGRRADKIMSQVNSLFTSSYVYHWHDWFPNKPLKYPPSFDGRIIIYPTDINLKDYLSWRQADVHINNLYNTTFWNLILRGGFTNNEAENFLKGTFAADKNEILFSRFDINYNNLPIMYRKGTTLLRKKIKIPNIDKERQIIIPFFTDMIQEKFWIDHYELLDKKTPQNYQFPKDEHGDCILSELICRQIESLSLPRDTDS